MLSFVTCGALAASLAGLAYLFFVLRWLKRAPQGGEAMRAIANRIAQGAAAFLHTEYRYIALPLLIITAALGCLAWYSQAGVFIAIHYLIGALLAGTVGFISMRIATTANLRTAAAAHHSLGRAFNISFMGGAAIGAGVVSFALLGFALLFIITYAWHGTAATAIDYIKTHRVVEALGGLALGAECVAFAARVSGGIFTKAADVGADIVGKVESGIPEDDPRNPATIADNVGDNVGDVAGTGADLFGSYTATSVAAIILGIRTVTIQEAAYAYAPLLMPLALGSLGLLASLFTSLVIKTKGIDNSTPSSNIRLGSLMATGLVAIGAYPLYHLLFPESFDVSGRWCTPQQLYCTTLIGLGIAPLINSITTYFTEMRYRPVQSIVRRSRTGPATNLIAGLSVGMSSIACPMLIFSIVIYCAHALASFYGVVLAAMSMMSMTAAQMTADALGPIADNAGGIVEMARHPAAVRARTNELDAVGNTTAAAGKSFTIASATLTSLGLLTALSHNANIQQINLLEAKTCAGLLLGTIIPFLCSALNINAVGDAAMAMVAEVRRQFNKIPGLLQGEASPDYDACIIIATRAALRKTVLPALLVLTTPILVGLCLGIETLGAFLMGVILTGSALALFQCNAGGALDNAKKALERGVTIAGQHHAKSAEAHTAAVIGDTVGDPLKDTSGPAMNILMKLMTTIGFVMTSL